ncbi:MAG: UbiD family decarboxylase [Desulfurococcales archaeon]|nr:UbiD family decarboxylase [Desulfurococcales archaeon]
MRDLSEVIRYLRSRGDVVEIKKEMEPELEPTKYIVESDRKNLTLMFSIKGSSIKCVANVLSGRRKLYELLKVTNDVEAYSKIICALRSKGKIKEVSFRDSYREVATSLKNIPAIKFYPEDGGRYITSSIVVAETPEYNSYNASIHRLMVLGDRQLAIRLVPRHLYHIVNENKKAGKETPVAIVIGAHPLALLAASLSPPYGVFELELFEHLSGVCLEIARTPIYGLPIPAYSSVVIEGRVTDELADEGPFLDILGLYDRVRKQPVVVVDKIYFSKECMPFHVILPASNEHRILMGFPREALIWEAVRKVVAQVRKVRLTPGGGCWLHAVISIRKNMEGDGKSAIMAAFAAHPSLKHVVVVDEDVDPDSIEEIEWAIATRLQAGKGLVIVRHARGSTLDPSSADGVTDKIGIDATVPLGREAIFRRPRTS